jgi:hypothetical protein
VDNIWFTFIHLEEPDSSSLPFQWLVISVPGRRRFS